MIDYNKEYTSKEFIKAFSYCKICKKPNKFSNLYTISEITAACCNIITKLVLVKGIGVINIYAIINDDMHITINKMGTALVRNSKIIKEISKAPIKLSKAIGLTHKYILLI